VTLTFDKERHAYAVDGVPVPSVTQVLAPLYDYSRVNRDVLAAKAELGTAVHAACELDDAGDLDEASVHELVRPYLDGYRAFKRDVVAGAIATELRVHHPLLRYAGTLDLLTEFRGESWLIDWKTPLSINPAVALQTVAYAQALPPEFQGRSWKRAALQLKADGKYRLHEFNDPNDWPTFVAMLTVHRWKERTSK
jgi:hypothetical protein